MYAYKIMSKNQRNGIKYADSYYFRLEDAEERIDHMKLTDAQETAFDPDDDWHYWIEQVKVRY